MKPRRVLVTASRTWGDRPRLYAALDRQASFAHHDNVPMVVVHGAADGGDTVASDWVRERQGLRWPVSEERHPVSPEEWRRGRGAGMRRNQRMVLLGADALLAFLDPCAKARCPKGPDFHWSHGAFECAAMAERVGIEVLRYENEPPRLRYYGMRTG